MSETSVKFFKRDLQYIYIEGGLEGSHHTLLNGYMRKFVKFSDAAEWHFLTEADREIRNGHILVFVAAPTKEEKDLIIQAFRNQGAFGIRYFSAIAIEEVV